MNSLTKFIRNSVIFVFMVGIILLMSACSSKEATLPYDACLFDKAERYLKQDFMDDNATHFPSCDDALPESRCIIIDTTEKYNMAFDTFPQEIDFNNEVLVVYLFTDIYYAFNCDLEKIVNDNEKLIITIKHEMATAGSNGAKPPSTSMPIQRCLVVKLHDCNFSNIEINLIY